jgi:hypothetical protein
MQAQSDLDTARAAADDHKLNLTVKRKQTGFKAVPSLQKGVNRFDGKGVFVPMY